VQKHSPSFGGEVSDVPFHRAVLPVRTNSAKGVLLLSGLAALDKSGLGENAIVGMDVLYFAIKASCKLLIFNFGS
jgi:hypothetical protein